MSNNTTTGTCGTTMMPTTSSNRKTMGRSARRRRKKLLEIQKAEEQLLLLATTTRTTTTMGMTTTIASSHRGQGGREKSTDNTGTTTTTIDVNQNHNNISMQVIPSDRSRVWPGVQELRRTGNSSGGGENSSSTSATTTNDDDGNNDDHSFWAKDAIRITSQLGYIPGNAIRIVTRAADVPFLNQLGSRGSLVVDEEEPVVVQLYPIAIRDEHMGGKAKRKKKQRKRKRIQQQQQQQPSDGVKEVDEKINDDIDSNKKKQEGLLNKNPQQQQKAKAAQEGEDEDDFVVEPFPTLYWLTHPLLKTLVSRMELQCLGLQLEKRLEQDDEAMAKIQKANVEYGKERYDLLTAQDIEFISKRKWQNAFDPKRGVAGIKNYASVKCLHAHVAHYLSHGRGSKDNILGKWVMEEIEKEKYSTIS